MKKIMSIMLLVVLVVLIPSAKALACDCGCDCCNKEKKEEKKSSTAKNATLQKKTNGLLKEVKKCAKENGWVITTEVSKNTKSKLYTNVHFENESAGCYMDLTIRATKKQGVSSAMWWFLSNEDGQWKRTSSEGIMKVLRL